jgi:hypothetical protein
MKLDLGRYLFIHHRRICSRGRIAKAVENLIEIAVNEPVNKSSMRHMERAAAATPWPYVSLASNSLPIIDDGGLYCYVPIQNSNAKYVNSLPICQ